MEASFDKSVKVNPPESGMEDIYAVLVEMVDQLKDRIFQHPDSIQAMTREVPNVDPLIWLSAQHPAEQTYWKSRDGQVEAAACGVCVSMARSADESSRAFIDRVRTDLLSSSDFAFRVYGGVAFDAERDLDDTWSHFGNGCFILPMMELRRTDEGCSLILQGSDACLPALQALKNPPRRCADMDEGIPPPVSRHDFPHQEAWIDRVRNALDSFAEGRLKKIVLARKAVYRFDDVLNVFALMRKLHEQTPNCFHFLFQLTEGESFIGASPERLYHRQGLEGRSEAVAGTRPRGGTEKIDHRQGEKLLESEKDQREHEFVRESIRRTLEHLSDSVRLDTRARLLKLSRGQHLYSGFEMQLRAGVTDADLISKLHPTPAVGGEPTQGAMEAMRTWEEFNRGWYAAPVGWMEKDAADFAVAIRSGLVQGDCLSLFSGAGIVEGSDPDSEWSEIENKISDFIHILTQR